MTYYGDIVNKETRLQTSKNPAGHGDNPEIALKQTCSIFYHGLSERQNGVFSLSPDVLENSLLSSLSFVLIHTDSKQTCQDVSLKITTGALSGKSVDLLSQWGSSSGKHKCIFKCHDGSIPVSSASGPTDWLLQLN